MKKLLTIMMALALVVVGAGVMKAEAATSDGITITVTFQSVSVTVSPDWSIGIVTTGATSTQACTATNNGNVNEDLTVAVSNSADWTVGVSGADTFKMDFNLDGGSTWTNLPSTSAVSLSTGVVPGDLDFWLQFTAPTSSSSTDQQSLTVTVAASAS